MAPEVVCVGSCNTDLFAYTPRLPRKGESIRGHRSEIGRGGKGANQAVMAARLGATVCMVGRVGDDAFGQAFVDAFRADGMDLSHLSVSVGASTGVAQIWVDDEGANSIVIVPGANSLLSPQDVRAAAPSIQAARVLLAQLEVPSETTLEALRLARAAGVLTILNPAPALPDLPEEFLQLSSLVCPNETELSMLTGGSAVDTMEQVEQAARTLQARAGCGSTVLVTLGERGALLLPPATDQPSSSPAAAAAIRISTDKVAAVDTSGAGDCFLGSLAAYLSRGVPLEQAVRLACRVASVSVQRPGTQSSYPSADALPPELRLPAAHEAKES